MLRIHSVPDDVDVVSVDGVAYSREIFQHFPEQANVGTIFRFVNKDEDGTVTVERLTPGNS
jgi:hypothetical protein